jgi:hypothetical protein
MLTAFILVSVFCNWSVIEEITKCATGVSDWKILEECFLEDPYCQQMPIKALRKINPNFSLSESIIYSNFHFKIVKYVGCWWLTPVILAIQEVEIRRIKGQSQPRQMVCKTLSQKYLPQKKGLVKWLKV